MNQTPKETELDRLTKMLKILERSDPSERDRILAYFASKYQLTCPQCGETYP